ncbi:CRISPR type AFERR-associated protein Csf2 [Burkholderia pseudomallei]|nr:CRISPR type AFERR-associated protein Csf2 [Burkholderia pseudomallei]
MTTIDVTLTLTSPLHLAYPGNTPEAREEDNREKKNKALTFKKKLMTGDAVWYVPCVPGNGLRGALRRKVADRLQKHLCAGDQSIPAELYVGLTCGASSGSPDNTPLSVAELLRARTNVYMGTFGGGARLLESAYRVSDINPVLKVTLERGVVPAFCADYVQPKRGGDSEYVAPWEITDCYHLIRRDDLMSGRGGVSLSQFVSSADAAAYQAQVVELESERKADKGGTKSVRNMMAIEAICAGTPMHFRIDVKPGFGDEHVGVLLLALCDIFAENAIGGWCRSGFGQYRVDQLRVTDGEECAVFTELHEDGVFRLPVQLSRYTEAAKEGIRRITLEEMMGYFTDFSAEKKAEKRAGRKAKPAVESA